jgi:hypothetical protein
LDQYHHQYHQFDPEVLLLEVAELLAVLALLPLLTQVLEFWKTFPEPLLANVCVPCGS